MKSATLLSPIATLMALVGKVLITILFWWDSITQFIMNYADTVAYIETSMLPRPDLVAIVTAVFLLVAPAMLFFKNTALLGSLGLAGFCAMTALIFHQYWLLDGGDRISEQIHFLKDLAIAGALLIVSAQDITRMANSE